MLPTITDIFFIDINYIVGGTGGGQLWKELANSGNKAILDHAGIPCFHASVSELIWPLPL